MSWQLHITGPGIPPRDYTVPTGGIVILGRADDNDVVLTSDCVSRRHVRFTDSDDGLRISDMGSRNGTQLNGRAVAGLPRLVRSGDVAQIGTYTIKIVSTSAQQQRVVPDGFVTLHSGAMSANRFLRQPAGPSVEDEDPVTQPGCELMHQLYALTQRLASAPTTELFLRDAVECARRVTGFDDGILLTLGEDGSLTPCVTSDDDGPPTRWSTTICSEAVRRNASLFVHDLASDTRFNMYESVVLAGSVHVLCIPLFSGTKALGVLYLSTRRAAAPSDEVLEFATAVGHIAATAMAGSQRCTRSAAGPAATAAVLHGIADRARFAHQATAELSSVLQRYRAALLQAGLTEEFVRAIETETGAAELLEEASDALELICRDAATAVGEGEGEQGYVATAA